MVVGVPKQISLPAYCIVEVTEAPPSALFHKINPTKNCTSQRCNKEWFPNDSGRPVTLSRTRSLLICLSILSEGYLQAKIIDLTLAKETWEMSFFMSMGSKELSRHLLKG
jgi:hypothetical protein